MDIYCIGDSLTEGDYGESGYRHMATFVAKALVDFYPQTLEIKKNII